MKQDERHLAPDDIFVGIDLATRQHQVVVLDLEGRRKTSFKIPHSRDGLRELVQRCNSPALRAFRLFFGQNLPAGSACRASNRLPGP